MSGEEEYRKSKPKGEGEKKRKKKKKLDCVVCPLVGSTDDYLVQTGIPTLIQKTRFLENE